MIAPARTKWTISDHASSSPRGTLPEVLTAMWGAVVSRFVWADGTGSEERTVRQVFTRLGLRMPKLLDTIRDVDPKKPLLAPAYVIRDGFVYRVVSDHLGTPRLFVDVSSGAVSERTDLDEWGTVKNDRSPDFSSIGFVSGLADPDTGLVRFGVRDYDPTVGRWTTKDPVRFGGGQPNLYMYVGDDPVNYRDRFGLDPSFLSIGGAAIIGSGVAIVLFGPVTWVAAGWSLVGAGSALVILDEVLDNFSGVQTINQAGNKLQAVQRCNQSQQNQLNAAGL